MQAIEYQGFEGLTEQDIKVLSLPKLAAILALATVCWLPIVGAIIEIWLL